MKSSGCLFMIVLIIGFFTVFSLGLIYALTGFWYNPLTDWNWHTVVRAYHYRPNLWNHTKEISVTGTIWNSMDLMSQKEVGFITLTFPDTANTDHIIDSIKLLYQNIGDSIIKTIK